MATIQIAEKHLSAAVAALLASEDPEARRSAAALSDALSVSQRAVVDYRRKALEVEARFKAAEAEAPRKPRHGISVVTVAVRVEPRVIVEASAHGSWGVDGLVRRVADELGNLTNYTHGSGHWSTRPVRETRIYCG